MNLHVPLDRTAPRIATSLRRVSPVPADRPGDDLPARRADLILRSGGVDVSNEPGRFVLGMGRTAIVDTADPDPMRSRIALYRGTPVIDLTPTQLEAALAELQKEFPQCPR